ncbi:Uncharacterised protein [Starkeya nomas]|uniref:Uncharacterized protein n=1 Tax=Starkeya nomas TaxID=2666134 RepID=A0A5S9R7W7_9HYPH|nr:hypothetical protein [Starkeya nomas]CAA0130238.1 Uncharacterised protein [Starkeya nomas]
MSKPTLGWPTRTKAVLALREMKMTTREIAAAIGIDVKTVCALEASAVRAIRERPQRQRGRAILLPLDVFDALGPEAARRNISPAALARLLVETVVDENMIGAVLDDADELGETA